MRIYELAKELGVDNRIVLMRAAELGMVGKSSHSNSLDPSEADQIRRAIIRQAVGAAPEGETVKTRIDRTTGETSSVVEKRKGNVIRRRKSEAVAEVEAAPSPAVQEVQTAPEAVVAATEEKIQSTSDQQGDATPIEVTTVSDQAEAEVTEPSSSTDEVIEASTNRGSAASADDSKKGGVGPRVLGKIALPTKKVITKPEPRRSNNEASIISAVSSSALLDDNEGRPGAKKAKGRKREISRADLVDYEGYEMRRGPRRPAGRSDTNAEKRATEQVAVNPQSRVVRMDESILVGELAKQMSVKVGDVIAKLMQLGVMATINQPIDKDTAQIIVEEFGCTFESTSFNEQTIIKDDIVDLPDQMLPRPPIVTVMGHVDHGKTSLLDTIRKASVASREHGGITQHIGAYTVKLDGDRRVTFIDTPGHAAFTSMRARGAQVTDIVVLVVAADDGVMPQTIEAINHAKAAKVTIVVAINKMDKPGANPDRIKQQLAEHGVQPEDWGGDSIFVPVSALKGTGIKELLEALLLVAEVKELRANPNRRSAGTVIESRQDRGRGTVATVLVQKGTLRVGDIFVSGAESGRLRSMSDDTGEKVESAGPSIAVEITGFSGMPEAGDDFFVVESEVEARQVAQSRSDKRAAKDRLLASGPISLEEFSKRASNTAALELNVILKADVHGSVGAVSEALQKLSTPKVKVRVLHSAVGAVNESDVQLAVASKAIVVGFGVRAEPRTVAEAELAGVELRFYRVIYELLDDVRKAMTGLLPKIKEESNLGRAEVRNTFVIPKSGTIAGSFVTSGIIRRGAAVRLLRDNKVVAEGKIGSLRRFKDDAREVQSGFECGIGIEGYNDIKVGDVLEVFEIKETAATLDA